MALGILGVVTGIGATSVATGDASTAINAIKQVAPHGLQVALSHVPSWTHAHQVLSQHLSQYAQNGAVGGTSGAGVAATIKRGLGNISKALLRH
ncbi:MAG: hypothetical protein JRN67_05055 [Nitrososphaerota archaeon]|nr:hypothetical protein [Nitrososphaerota archaeon]